MISNIEPGSEAAWLSRVYVEVNVRFDTGGTMFPTEIRWENGRIYKIDEIVTIRETEVAYTGRRRERYVVKIRGQMCSLFFERTKLPLGPQFGRWYVERKTEDSGKKTA